MSIKKFYFINKTCGSPVRVILKCSLFIAVLLSQFSFAQLINPIYLNKKWGYESFGKLIIEPQYDTVYTFDETNRIALVANKNAFNKEVNPISGEEEFTYDYFFINKYNQKLKLVDENFPDTMFTFSNQQELSSNYLTNSNFFKVLFQKKVYLFHKTGKQLSSGFDNIYLSKSKKFYYTENYSELDNKPIRILGLIDTSGKTIARNKYHEISINQEDSVVFCCSAVFSNKTADDVYSYNGKLIYSNKKHIVFSSKTIHVVKTYEPKEAFIVENELTKKTYDVAGEEFMYLKNNKALIKQGSELILLDLLTTKEKKINQEKLIDNIYSILEL